MSKTIQNELIYLRDKEIVTDIISEVKESRVFSILADEVRDCSNTEQISFVMRYVDKSCQIREEFIQFLKCESGASGQELCLKIVNRLMLSETLILKLVIYEDKVMMELVQWQGKKWCIVQNFKTE